MFVTPSKKRKFESVFISPAMPSAKKSSKSTKTRKLSIKKSPSTSYGTLVRSGFSDITITNGSTSTNTLTYNSLGYYLNGTIVNWPGGTDISSAYDAYRIMKIKIKFIYNNNYSSVGSNAFTLPYFGIANDVDDVFTSSIADINQRDGATLKLCSGEFLNWTVVPKVAVGAYATAVATGYMEPKAKQWVSTGGPSGFQDPQHYGTKFYVDCTKQTTVTGTQGTVRVYIKAYFQMKHAQ